MCATCWDDRGRPVVDTPAVRVAADLVAALYDTALGCVGGYLHIVTDDWNVEDSRLDWCIERMRTRVDDDSYKKYNSDDLYEMRVWCWACAKALQALTETERYSALALSEGFWE